MKHHWYYISEVYCPICGSSQTTRTRVYGRRPKDISKTREFVEAWDGCGV